MSFTAITPTSIANRVCQKLGQELIAAGALTTEDSKAANQIVAAWDWVRRAELRAHPWVFGIRTEALRPLGFNTKQITFGTYSAVTTYVKHDVVIDPADNQIYQSRVVGNLANTPSASPTQWRLYFGPLFSTEFITTWGSGFTFNTLDHTVGSDGNVYISVADANINHNPVGDGGVHWIIDSSGYFFPTTQTFFAGELVHIGTTLYMSLYNSNGQGTSTTTPSNILNGPKPPSATWITMTTAPTIAIFNFIYPVGAGPQQNLGNENVYMLPNGYLSMVSQDPKAGQALFLGAPDGAPFKDWVLADNYYTTMDSDVTLFRFMSDQQDVTKFDPLFIEGFACRLAIELCEPITNSTGKKQSLEADYKKFMGDAALKNAIENGPTYPPEDSYVTCRI